MLLAQYEKQQITEVKNEKNNLSFDCIVDILAWFDKLRTYDASSGGEEGAI